MKNVALSQAKGREIGSKISYCLGTLSTIDDQRLFRYYEIISPHYTFLNSVHKLLLVLNEVPLSIRGDFHLSYFFLYPHPQVCYCRCYLLSVEQGSDY